MSARRSTGPRVSAGAGPRMGIAQPAAPTTVQLGGDRLLAGARLGRSGVLEILGEPGIGKSALLEYAADAATGQSRIS